MSLKNLLLILVVAFSSCGSSYEIISFSPNFKTCTSTSCTTYMTTVIEVNNTDDSPVDLILTCDYYHNGTLTTSISTEVPLNEWERTKVEQDTNFTNHPDDASFYSVLCKLEDR
jgi:hypothetical protein